MMKKYFFIAGLFLSVWGQNAMAQKIDTKGKGEPFLHYWSEGTCAGRANNVETVLLFLWYQSSVPLRFVPKQTKIILL